MPHTAHFLPAYRLARHVRACRVSDQVVLLDLHRDKYLGIASDQQPGLSQAIADWPAIKEGTSGPTTSSAGNTVLQSLLGQNMLVDAATPTLPAAALTPPTMSFDITRVAEAHAATRDLIALAWAASITALTLKHRSLDAMVSRIVQLRRHAKVVDSPDTASDLRNAVWSYLRLRPFLFTAHDKCLHDSLTLVRYLARKRLRATWVIGVKTRPFVAHSWVQAGDTVLNDVHDHVRRYTPILVV